MLTHVLWCHARQGRPTVTRATQMQENLMEMLDDLVGKDVEACSGPSCYRPAVAEGLCAAHYKQKQRGRPLAPLRERGSPRVLVAARVSADTYAALGGEPGVRAREVLESWARSHLASNASQRGKKRLSERAEE